MGLRPRGGFHGSRKRGWRNRLVVGQIIRIRQIRWTGHVGAVLKTYVEHEALIISLYADATSVELQLVTILELAAGLERVAIDGQRRAVSYWLYERDTIKQVE